MSQSIGSAAATVGITADTLRYYEKSAFCRIRREMRADDAFTAKRISRGCVSSSVRRRWDSVCRIFASYCACERIPSSAARLCARSRKRSAIHC